MAKLRKKRDPVAFKLAPIVPLTGGTQEAKLATRLKGIDMKDIPLRKALEYVREASGANVVANWPALALLGVDQDMKLTIKADGISGADLLHRICRQLSIVDPVSFRAQDGVVLVSSKDDLCRETVIRVYDIRDLVGPDASRAKGRTHSSLMDLILDFVDPTSWRDYGGLDGSARLAGHLLVVRQARRRHREVADLLSQLRAALAVREALPVAEAAGGWPETLFTDRATLSPWVIGLIDMAVEGKAGPVSSVHTKKVGDRLLALVGGYWIESTVQGSDRIAPAWVMGPAAKDAAAALGPDGKALLESGYPVIIRLDEGKALLLSPEKP